MSGKLNIQLRSGSAQKVKKNTTAECLTLFKFYAEVCIQRKKSLITLNIENTE